MMTTKTTRFVPFWKAQEGDITFLRESNPELARPQILQCKASKIFVHADVYCIFDDDARIASRLVPVRNPKLEFIREMLREGNHTALDTLQYHGRSPMNDINSDCNIAEGAVIMNTTMGYRCTVHSGTRIGFPALSGERDEKGNIVRFPHIGRVLIGHNVWIGTQCNISRGTLDDTIIGHDVTIDDHVHIAHNCVIGERTQITAGSIFGGSVTMGKDCWMGLNATINDHVNIGDNVLIGAGAVVTKDMPNKEICAGVPALSIKHKCNLPPARRYRMVGY